VQRQKWLRKKEARRAHREALSDSSKRALLGFSQ
jgi:hypothetical protein